MATDLLLCCLVAVCLLLLLRLSSLAATVFSCCCLVVIISCHMDTKTIRQRHMLLMTDDKTVFGWLLVCVCLRMMSLLEIDT